MSTKPCSRLSFRHDVVDTNHQIVIFGSKGEPLIRAVAKNFDAAYRQAAYLLELKIEEMLDSQNYIHMREVLKPSDKRGSGLFPISKELWDKITYSDFIAGFMGVITQSELSRIRKVSRQAIHQTIVNGTLECFVFQKQKYIPIDIVASSAETNDVEIEPNVYYYKHFSKTRQRIRRDYKLQPKPLPFVREI